MARRHEHHASYLTPQLQLFPGCLDHDVELRRLLTNIIEECPHTREKIAGRMSELTASKVTAAMLDAWTAPSRAKWNMPLKFLSAFNVATGSDRLLRYLAGQEGSTIISGEERVDAEIGRLLRVETETRTKRERLLAGATQ